MCANQSRIVSTENGRSKAVPFDSASIVFGGPLSESSALVALLAGVASNDARQLLDAESRGGVGVVLNRLSDVLNVIADHSLALSENPSVSLFAGHCEQASALSLCADLFALTGRIHEAVQAALKIEGRNDWNLPQERASTLAQALEAVIADAEALREHSTPWHTAEELKEVKSLRETLAGLSASPKDRGRNE